VSDRALLHAAVALSAAALVGVAFLLVTERGGSSTPAPASAPAPVIGQVTAPTVGHVTAPALAQPKEKAASPSFWQLIDETRAAAGPNTSRQSELLKERLMQLSPQAIVEFAKTRRRLDEQAYTWKLLGAAATIEDGCSDDCFHDFRGYVISLGRGPYEQALRDSDSLASVARDAESGNWENADDVASDAYSSVTGNDFPLADTDLSGRPAGTPIDLSDSSLRARFRAWPSASTVDGIVAHHRGCRSRSGRWSSGPLRSNVGCSVPCRIEQLDAEPDDSEFRPSRQTRPDPFSESGEEKKTTPSAARVVVGVNAPDKTDGR
jgi:hypothetical protein